MKFKLNFVTADIEKQSIHKISGRGKKSFSVKNHMLINYIGFADTFYLEYLLN